MCISRLALSALLPTLLLPSLATSISFSPTGIGAGAASTDLSSFGFSTSTGGLSSAGVGSTGGPHNSANLFITSTSTEDTGVTATPDANAMPLLNSLGLPTVVRPVPYQPGTAHPAPAATGSGTKRIKRKVKRAVSPTNAPVLSPPAQSVPNRCWVVRKQCCWTEVNRGYKCRDFYQHKYARCHPVIDYEQECTEETDIPEHHPKPERKTKFEETIIKNYDPNYGPHVQGYPQKGESELYFTEDIPARPHGVTGEPFAPMAAAPMPSVSEQGVNGGGYVGGNGGEEVVTTTVTSETTSYAPKETGPTKEGVMQTEGVGGGSEAPVTTGVAYTPKPTAGPAVSGGVGGPSYTAGSNQGGNGAGGSYRR